MLKMGGRALVSPLYFIIYADGIGFEAIMQKALPNFRLAQVNSHLQIYTFPGELS